MIIRIFSFAFSELSYKLMGSKVPREPSDPRKKDTVLVPCHADARVAMWTRNLFDLVDR